MERRDLYDENRNFTGKTILKGEKVPDGYYIIVVMIVIENKDGEFLIQKRSLEKDGKWANTGGHPKSGENSLEGIITEVKEELGLDISNEDIKLVSTRTAKNIICDLYYVNMDIDLDKIVCQEEEVETARLMTLDEINKLIKNGEFKENHIEAFFDVVNKVKGGEDND